jgi:Lon protease-like protein
MSEMLTLRTRGPFRDARGRFRRKTREDMSDFERIMHDATMRMVRKWWKPNPLWESLMASPVDNDRVKIGTTLRVRLPTDFKVIDRAKLTDG